MVSHSTPTHAARNPQKSNMRGNLHESFPCVIGTEAARIHAQLDEAAAALKGDLISQAWVPHPKKNCKDVETKPGLLRMTTTVPKADFTLAEALATFAFFHVHTHSPMILQSCFVSFLEQAKVLALLPLSTSGSSMSTPGNSASSRGGGRVGPDSSAIKAIWTEKKQRPKEFILAQRTGRFHAPSSGDCETSGDFVYYLATSIKNPDHVPILGLSSPSGATPGAPAAQQVDELPLVAFVVGPSAQQGAVDVTVILSQGLIAAEETYLRPCLALSSANLGRYVTETIQTHRALSLALPDLTLALISPFAGVHRILLKMPETPASAPAVAVGSPAATSGATYRVVTVRFLPASKGDFTVGGLGPGDQALFPRPFMEKILHRSFSAGEMQEVRFITSSSETKELQLLWTELQKGRLHRYTVDVRVIYRAAVSRTVGWIESMSYLPRASAGLQNLKAAKEFSITRPAASVSVIRYPQHLKEAMLPLACLLPAAFNSSGKKRTAVAITSSPSAFPISPQKPTKQIFSSPFTGSSSASSSSSWTPLPSQSRPPHSNSISALLLPHLIHPSNRLTALLDTLWPLAMSVGFHAFLFHALKHYPEAAAAVDDMSLWALALGLGLTQLSLGVALHGLVTNKVKVYMQIARLDFAVLDRQWWWRVIVSIHVLCAAAFTAILGLAARVMTSKGGWAESHKWVVGYLNLLRLDKISEDKLLLMGGVALLSLIMGLVVSVGHWWCGSNRALNIAVISLLDKSRVLSPQLAAPANHLFPLGKHHHHGDRPRHHHSSSKDSAVDTLNGSVSTSSSLDLSLAPALLASGGGKRITTPRSAPAEVTKRRGLSTVFSRKSTAGASSSSSFAAVGGNTTSRKGLGPLMMAGGGEADLQGEEEGARIMQQQGSGGGGGEEGGALSSYGRVVEPDYEREMGRSNVDKAMCKSGMVKEERYTGSGLSRHRVWKVGG